MDDAVVATSESLSTVLTLKGFLPSVDSLMPEEFGVVAEGFPTVRTCEGFLSTVEFLVLKEV